MPNLTQLRLTAREIFDETLRAIDAGDAVGRFVRLEESRLNICDVAIDLGDKQPIYSIALGKAGLPMAIALGDALGERLTSGLIAGPIAGQALGRDIAMPPRKLTTRWQWCEGGHPLPTKSSLAAASEALALLKRADEERALIIFLVSGGGSAMLELPISDNITLGDLRVANKVLVNSGASINEINAVRRAFSAVKGGRLAARAPHCDQMTVIVSDVPSGDERNVASGPSLAPLNSAPNAREVIHRFGLRSQLPESVLHAISVDPDNLRPPDLDSAQLRKHFVLLDNRSALEAAAAAGRRRGLTAEIIDDISDQFVEEGCTELLKELNTVPTSDSKRRSSESICLISGGEFACPVRGDGIGGRNLETALRLAIEYEKLKNQERIAKESNFVALCAGTDGIDGNSPAAGAIVDNTTIERARAVGLDPQEFLDRSDAYSFFVALGDTIATGPTGTNVRDLRILVAS